MFYINGSYVKEGEAAIPVLDLGLLRGYGVFDYLRTYQGRPFHLWEHLLRLQYSAKQIGISLPLSLQELEKVVKTLLSENGYAESGIKIILTGGISPDQFHPEGKPTLIVLVYPHKPFNPALYTEGISVTTTSLNRSFPMSKTLQYTPAIVAMQKGKGKNALEALYVNEKQEILEATTSNFFGFKQGVLHTCFSEEILLGITREVVLHLCRSHFPLKQAAICIEDISHLEEAFITSSNKEIMPVVQIDEKRINDGKVGEKTKQLMGLFSSYTKQESWPQLSVSRYL